MLQESYDKKNIFKKFCGNTQGPILLNFLRPYIRNDLSRGLYYKTFYGRNLRIFVIS
jgi:hypothetical protein